MEDQTRHVGQLLNLELVHADEHNVGVLLGHLGRRIAQGETDRDDRIETLIDELLHVVFIIFGVFGLNVLDLGARIIREPLHAFPRRLVEAAIVDAAHVRHEADLKALFSFFPTARRQNERRDCEDGQY